MMVTQPNASSSDNRKQVFMVVHTVTHRLFSDGFIFRP